MVELGSNDVCKVDRDARCVIHLPSIPVVSDIVSMVLIGLDVPGLDLVTQLASLPSALILHVHLADALITVISKFQI